MVEPILKSLVEARIDGLEEAVLFLRYITPYGEKQAKNLEKYISEVKKGTILYNGTN